MRNPLQTVLGELYLAKSEVDGLPVSEVKRNLQESIRVLDDQAAYMDKIVSDLQAFVRPVRIVKSVVVLKDTFGDVLASIGVPDDVSVQMQIDSRLSVKADLQLLKRVLINLVTNALQAMPNGES